MNYIEKWSIALKDVSFKKFNSFILPLVLIPLAVKGVQEIAKAVKKSKDKEKFE